MGCGISRPSGWCCARWRRPRHSYKNTSGHSTGHSHGGVQGHVHQEHGHQEHGHQEYGHQEHEHQEHRHDPVHGGEQGHESQSVVGSAPPSLASLGYGYRESGREEDSDEPGRVQIKYIINQVGNPCRIMMLGCNLNNGLHQADNPVYGLDDRTLFIEWLAMDYDTRPKNIRPKPRDLLASMWVHVLDRSLLLLRRVYFQAVIEATTRRVVREKVCPLMKIDWNEGTNGPDKEFTLFQPGRSNHPENDEAFEEICDRSKFVKVVASIPARYPQMIRPRRSLLVAEIKIVPSFRKDGNPGAFDMEVVLEDSDSSDSNE